MKRIAWPACLVAGVLAFSACSAAPRPRPVAVPGVEHGETTVRGGRHVDLYAQWWRPQGQPVRAALVIVHGLKDHGGRYAAFAQALAKRGFAVYAEDLRGHGRSGGARVWVDQFDDYVLDVERFVQGVRQREPDVPVFLMGHSMGGAIATLTALDKPELLSGLVLSAAALKPGADVSPGLLKAAKALGDGVPYLPLLALDDDLFCHDRSVVQDMHEDPLVYDHDGPAHTAAELLDALARIQARGRDLRVPVLALHGTDDRVTNPDGSKELVATARTADKTLKLFPGLYHDLVHEPQHAQVEADVTAWLEAHVK